MKVVQRIWRIKKVENKFIAFITSTNIAISYNFTSELSSHLLDMHTLEYVHSKVEILHVN